MHFTVWDNLQIELEFGNVGFEAKGKLEYPKKTSWSKDENQQQTLSTHVIMIPSPGIKPRLHWWAVSALTTVPALLPQDKEMVWRKHKL